MPKAKPAQAPPDFFPVPANHAMTLVENENEPKCEHDKQFDLFWQLYPRKASKKAARKAWADIKPDDVLFSTIMTALNAAVRYWQHQGVLLKHIPHPSTWLNEERWEDEFPFPAAQPTGFDGGSHAVRYTAKHTTKQQGGGQIAANGADYTIGGDNDPYGMSVTEYLDDMYAAGIEFAGTKLEHHANSMKRTAKMLNLIDTAMFLIREHNSEGEMFYWILYYTYLSPLKLSGVEEIIDRVQMHIPYATRDTYYRGRKRAIKTFASVLWGFTAKGEIGILDTFV